MNKLTILELGKVASATKAEFLRKLQPLVHTADLPKVDIDSVLLKTAFRLSFFNKKRNIYPFATLQSADYAVVGQIISQNLPENIRSEYFAKLQRQNAARIPKLYNAEGLDELGNKASIYLPEWAFFEEDHKEYLETFRNCPITEIFYYWFDTQSNPPSNFKHMTSGSQLNLPSKPLSGSSSLIRTRSRGKNPQKQADDEKKPELKYENRHENMYENRYNNRYENRQENDNEFNMAAAAAEQSRQQYVAAILAKQFKGTSKFSSFIQTFEMLIEEHDEAGSVGHRVEMMPQKKRLLIAILWDPSNSPLKGIDGRRFVGPQTYITDLPVEQTDTYDKIVMLLTTKYDQKREEMSAITVANRLRMLKQDGKPIDEYITLYEDTRDRFPAAQVGTILTDKYFVVGLILSY